MANKLDSRASRERLQQNRFIALTTLVLVAALIAPGAGQSSQRQVSQPQNAGVITEPVVKMSAIDFSRLSAMAFGDNDE
jgi:hypothetical protein